MVNSWLVMAIRIFMPRALSGRCMDDEWKSVEAIAAVQKKTFIIDATRLGMAMQRLRLVAEPAGGCPGE
jgi:hypothetical protein